jgi:hypothetical protein
MTQNGKEYYIKKDIRNAIANIISSSCSEKDLTYAMCREDLIKDTGYCDPFHLLPSYKPKKKQRRLI